MGRRSVRCFPSAVGLAISPLAIVGVKLIGDAISGLSG
jgi:hypothetical protein